MRLLCFDVGAVGDVKVEWLGVTSVNESKLLFFYLPFNFHSNILSIEGNEGRIPPGDAVNCHSCNTPRGGL